MSLNTLKSKLGMGARSNKYRIIMSGIQDASLDTIKIDTLAKSTIIPQKSFHEIEIWDRGRQTIIAGDTDFSGTWSVTFMDSQDHSLRKSFLSWMDFMDDVLTNSRGAIDHNSYMTEVKLQILSTIDNSVTCEYILNDVWIKSISDSNLADDNSDLLEFTVEFNYSSWVLV